MSQTALDERLALPGREAGAVAAAVAGALAELHGAGLVHGAVGPDRVLVDDLDTVTLLPAADPLPTGLGPADDVAALGGLLAWLAERAPDRPANRGRGLLRVPHPADLLDELAHRCRVEDPTDRPPARLIADVFHRNLPAVSRSSEESTPAPVGRGPRDRRVAVGTVALVALVAGAAVPAECSPPPADARKQEASARWSGGVLTLGAARYAVGEPGDHVLVERWECGPRAVALLRRAHGEVVAFDRFPKPQEHVVGRALARVPTAGRLLRRATENGCAELAVATADGHTIPVPWKEVS